MTNLVRKMLKKIFSFPKQPEGLTNATPHKTYDPERFILVPTGQAIYDPEVFGRYDLESQRIIPRSEVPNNWLDLDIILEKSQRLSRTVSKKIPHDRYEQVLRLIPNGTGLCLDACTNQPREDVRNAIQGLGYIYQPIDITGGEGGVRREDLMALDFPNESVSLVISLDTLEHIKNYRKAIDEIFRVLVSNGIAIFHVPCYYFEKQTGVDIRESVDPFGHVRYFSARELLDSFDNVGFTIHRINFNLDYGALLVVLQK